ncbi:MAG: ATP-binding protein [Salinibacter sp.]
MASSLFDVLSFLRPTDDALTERETWLVQVYRLLSIIGGTLIPVFGVLYEFLPTAYVDPWSIRLAMAGLFGLLVVGSYLSVWVRRHYMSLMCGCLYLLVAWVGALAALNRVSGDYAVAFLFVFCVVGICIGIGLQRIAPLLWFLGYSILISVSVYLFAQDPQTSSFALVGCTATLSIVLYVVFQARLSMRRQLEAAREEAKTASRLKSALLANMSHEVRTPLTSILGFAELIADADPEDPEALAASIRRSGRRLLDTLDSVLQVSQLQTGDIDFDPEPFDLVEVVAKRVEALTPMAEQNGVQLEFSRRDPTVKTQMDVRATGRIVEELVRNAVDFSEAGDRAWVEVEGHPEHVTIMVEDTGIGMKKERLEKLIRPFEQASVGQDRTHEGVGLGLTVVYHLVRLMDGSINVESEIGKGTRVTVTLPRHVSAQDLASARDRTPIAK